MFWRRLDSVKRRNFINAISKLLAIVLIFFVILLSTTTHMLSIVRIRSFSSDCCKCSEVKLNSTNFTEHGRDNYARIAESSVQIDTEDGWSFEETNFSVDVIIDRHNPVNSINTVLSRWDSSPLPGKAHRISWLIVPGTEPSIQRVKDAEKHFQQVDFGSMNFKFLKEDIVVESPVSAYMYVGTNGSPPAQSRVHGINIIVKYEDYDTNHCIIIHEPTFIPYLDHQENPFHFFGDTWHSILPLIQTVSGQKALEDRNLRIFLTFKRGAFRKSWIERGWGMAGFYSELSKFPLQALGSIRNQLCFKNAVVGPGIGGRQMEVDVPFYIRRFRLTSFPPVKSACPRILLVQRQSMDQSRFFDAGRTILNIQLVDIALRDAFGSWYIGSVSFELLPLATALQFMRSADIVIVMHGAGHTMAAAFMREDSWLLELSWQCRDTVLKNTGKVIKGRKVNQKNYVVPFRDLQPVPRGWIDGGSHFVGSSLSGVSTSPKCTELYPKPFHTVYGNSDFGYWCGKHRLTHDTEYNDECRMNVILNPGYVINIVHATRKHFKNTRMSINSYGEFQCNNKS